MKNFQRQDLLFSLCGLNCALCTMKLDHYCPGCGGGAGNQGCAIARCSLQHGDMEYCYQCGAYPCEKYAGITQYDSFITHRNQLKDMAKMQAIGAEVYHAELAEKSQLLQHLLENYNDGRRKSFFSLAVNLLDLQDLRLVMEQVAIHANQLTTKEKAALMATRLQAAAEQKNIILKLNKKTAKQ